jgi:hypothetical protein
MTTPDNAYWDELGVEWRALNPDPEIIGPRLKSRLRRQSLLIRAGLVAGLLLGAGGVILSLITIWIGWTSGTWNFVTRGIAIGAVSVFLAMAVSVLLPVRGGDAARAVSDLLDLAIARAQRTLVVIRLGLYACVVVAVFGLAGAAIRTHFTGPPRISPVADVTAIAIVALGLFVRARHIRTSLAKLRALKHALGKEPERR